MIKVNWGTSLLIFFIAYISVLGIILVNSFRQDHQLVVEDYYQADISYQSHYNKRLHTSDLKSLPKIKFDGNTNSASILFGDPELSKKGSVLFYCPADKNKDKTVPFVLNKETALNIENLNLKKGKWIVKLNWTQNETDYYYEDQLIVN